MIKKISFILFIIFISALFIILTDKKSEMYKVIEVVEGDKFYIDLNKNNEKDPEELFHLKNVNSFPLRYNSKTNLYSKRFNLDEKDIFALGYLGKKFSEKLLLNKYVDFSYLEDYNPNFEYRFASINFEGFDYALILLESGFGFSYSGAGGNLYKSFEDMEKIKENAEIAKKYDLKIVDDENKEFHELNCKKALKEKIIKIFPKSKMPKDYHKCKYCYLKSDFMESVKEFFSKVEVPNFHKKFQNLELFLIYPNSYLVRSKSCRSDVCKSIVKNIDNSKTSINFALYGFEEQDEILNALLRAKKRGVIIRGVVDSNSKGENIYKDTFLLEKYFPIKKDNHTDLMHNKFMVFDGKTVFTGSVNFSSTGLGSYNSNSAVFITNKDAARAYNCEFEEMFKGNFHNKKQINCSITNIKISNDTVFDVYFSPKGDIYQNIFSPLIKNAKSEILISIFYLTNREITNDLIDASKRGVKIKIIMDSTSTINPKSTLKDLRNAKIPVKVENWGGKNHEKTMLVDSQILVLGSSNFTNSAIKRNDENTLVIKNPDIAKFYWNFFMKLYSSINDKYLIKIPSAESFESGYSCYDGVDNDYDGDIDEKDSMCNKIQ